jgi:hypothetical protein
MYGNHEGADGPGSDAGPLSTADSQVVAYDVAPELVE